MCRSPGGHPLARDAHLRRLGQKIENVGLQICFGLEVVNYAQPRSREGAGEGRALMHFLPSGQGHHTTQHGHCHLIPAQSQNGGNEQG